MKAEGRRRAWDLGENHGRLKRLLEGLRDRRKECFTDGRRSIFFFGSRTDTGSVMNADGAWFILFFFSLARMKLGAVTAGSDRGRREEPGAL